MAKALYIVFMLIVFLAPVFSDETDEQNNIFEFDDIFKSIPTLFEYLLQMVEERPEILEKNDIELMKRQIETNNCEKCNLEKREVNINFKCPSFPVSHDTDNKVSGESVMEVKTICDNVDVNTVVDGGDEIKCGNQKREIILKPQMKIYSNDLKRSIDLRMSLGDRAKRNSSYETCSNSLYDVQNKHEIKRTVYNFADNNEFTTAVNKYGQSNTAARRNINDTESNNINNLAPIEISNKNAVKSTDEINVDTISTDQIPMNEHKYEKNYADNDSKINYISQTRLENKRSASNKRTSDMNTFKTLFLTPEEVEDHILKVEQMLEEYERKQTK